MLLLNVGPISKLYVCLNRRCLVFNKFLERDTNVTDNYSSLHTEWLNIITIEYITRNII